jgi:hypothetical protein
LECDDEIKRMERVIERMDDPHFRDVYLAARNDVLKKLDSGKADNPSEGKGA